MLSTRRRHFWRLFILGFALMGAMACGTTQCDCVTPLDQPMGESAKVYDAVQARLTPEAFSFIEGNLTDIIGTFLQGGLEFEVPSMRQEIDMFLFTLVIDICQNGCTLTAEIADATLSPVAPNVLHLDAHLNLTGTVYMTNDVTCDIPINVQNKPVSADVILLIDGRDKLLYFTLANLAISIEDADFELDCSGLLGWVIELLKGTITNLINDQLSGMLDDTVGGMLDGATCLACDFYSGGCPTGSACDGDYCMDGTCLTNPLGVVGTMDMGTLLADFSPGLQAELDLFLAAGQWSDATTDPLVVDNGVEIRMIGGAEAERNLCVPDPNPADIPSAAPPPRLAFNSDSTIPGTGDTYMAGIGVSDAFLDWFLYKAYLSGMLCLSLGTESTGGMLSSGTLSALLGSLNTLTGGLNTPIVLKMRPQKIPYIEVGAGTFTMDDQGNRIMDEPLLNVFIPELALDFYVLINERLVRVVTLTQDLTLLVGLDFLPDNTVLPIFDENSIIIENVVATNYELLAEDPSSLESLVPTLIGLAMPLLTGSLGAIEIPALQGFVLDISAVQGDMPRQNSSYFEYMGLYANLSLAATPLPAPSLTRARVDQVRVPTLSAMSIYAPGGPAYPEVVIDVSAEGYAETEYSYRVDAGVWSLYRPGPKLTVRSPLLALTGEHSIEVRSRQVGDYRTLDPQPELLKVWIAPKVDGLRYDPPLPAKTFEALGIKPLGQAIEATPASDAEPSRVGCATSSGGSALLAPFLLLLGLAWLRRKS